MQEFIGGAPERVRTSDPRIRNPVLCPTELPGRSCKGLAGLIIGIKNAIPNLAKLMDCIHYSPHPANAEEVRSDATDQESMILITKVFA